jgi:hypothetical protein
LDAQEEIGNGAQAAHTGTAQNSERLLLGSAEWFLEQEKTDPGHEVGVKVGCEAG